ncbi:MAG: cytochrome C oxidase subunit IV family protein [Candidatus Kapabacteria bacterium]|nr:cytochrome C oxidase subunit IV family protein [Candidatus Kapabacteria bacterium]
MAHNHAHSHPPEEVMMKEYWKVFTILLVMTVITVAAAEVQPLHGMAGVYINLILGLAIATFKVFKVMQIFMHLKFDHKYLRAFVFIPVFLFFVMVFALTQLENFNHP